MSYELPDVVTYEWGQDATFGTATVTHEIVGPRGKVGFVRDISIDVTTLLVGTTSVPEICVGLTSGDVTFGRYCLGTTATLAYATLGMRSASDELITGNPPRSLSDYAPTRTSFTTGPRILLDGAPLGTLGSIAGGTATTVNPLGKIPAGPFTVTNVISGAASVCRVFVKEGTHNLVVGQTVQVTNVAGATGANVRTTISALSTDRSGLGNSWMELTGTTFGGTYTSGGLINLVAIVSCQAGSGSSAGGGFVRVKVQWVGVNNP